MPSACASDLSELLRVPMRSQGYCGVGRGLSRLHWVWCNARGPHLELKWEPEGSYPFLTLIPGSLQGWNRRVRPHLVLRNGTQLASRVVHGMTGHLSGCIWNLWVFPDYSMGVSVPLHVVTSSTGLHSKRCLGIGFLSRVDGEIGVFLNVARPTRVPLEFLCETGLLLRVDGKVRIPFQKAEESTLMSISGEEKGLRLSSARNSVFLRPVCWETF